MKFLYPGVALYLNKSIYHLNLHEYEFEYCCHVWAGAPKCYLNMLDKLQKRVCRTFGPSLAAFLEPLADHQNAATLTL